MLQDGIARSPLMLTWPTIQPMVQPTIMCARDCPADKLDLDLTAFSTADLLRMMDDGGDHGEDFRYNAQWCVVFPRWRQGVDLEPLVALLQSEKSKERGRGAFYLEEATPPSELIGSIAVRLADDPIGYCRWKFVAYVINTRFYNDTVSNCLAACLLDQDLRVRAETIFWGVMVDDGRFADFSHVLLSVAGKKAYRYFNAQQTAFWQESETRRAVRGLDIVRRLRTGETIADVRKTVSGEDSLLFDLLASRQRAMKRANDRRSACGAATE